MRFPTCLTVLAMASAMPQITHADEVAQTEMFSLPAPAGWVLGPDQVTLVVSQPKTAELLYFDTVHAEEPRRVSVDFAPGVLAMQGNDLYVAADGAALVYRVEFGSGKVQKEFEIPGNGITDLACHPEHGPIYAATATYDVFSIEPESGKVASTEAVGNRVKVDAQNERVVFTGVLRNDVTDVFLIKAGRRGEIRIIYDRWGPRSGILKYRVSGKKLQFEDVQENATVNAYQLCLTPDGKQIMMTGGGGWRPPADTPGTGGGYYTAVFSTSKLDSMAGKAPHASNIAYHPKLRLAVANHMGRDLHLFDPKTFVEKQTIHIADGAGMQPLLLTFVAKGTKIAVWNGDNPANPREGLHFVPFPLTDAERAALAAAYGKLPPAEAVAARPATTEKPEVPARPPAADAPAADQSAPNGAIALAGFNDARGLGGSRAPGAPYRLGASNQPGGLREPGWSGPWPALDKANFQREVVFEGDGALWLQGTANYSRQLARPLADVVEVEHYVRVPKGSNFTCYIWETDYTQTGPMWRVADGRFESLNGDEGGGGKWLDTQIVCEPDRWYRVVASVNTNARRWTLSLPEQQYSSAELRYRARPQKLMQLNYLTEHPDGVYIDAIQVRKVSPAGPATSK